MVTNAGTISGTDDGPDLHSTCEARANDARAVSILKELIIDSAPACSIQESESRKSVLHLGASTMLQALQSRCPCESPRRSSG